MKRSTVLAVVPALMLWVGVHAKARKVALDRRERLRLAVSASSFDRFDQFVKTRVIPSITIHNPGPP